MSGTITGTVALGGATKVLAGVAIQGAVFEGPGTVASTGVVTVQVDDTQLTGGAVWINSGIVDITTGGIINTLFTNQATGVVILDGDPFASGDTITNAGTLETDSTGVTNFYAPITDTGTINIANAETLLFTEGGDFSGPVAGSGLLMLEGGVSTLASTFSHGGVLEIVNGTIALGGMTTTLAGLTTLQGAVFDGPGTVASTGVVTVQVDDTKLTGGAVWVNSGTVDMTGGEIINTPFTNQATGVVILDGDPFASGDTITNAGTLETDSTGVTNFYAPITDTGTINIANAETLLFTEGGDFSGPVAGSGLLMLEGGVSTLASTFSHGGVLEIVNGTIALGGMTTTLAGLTTLQGAVFDGPGTVASTGVVTVQVDDTQLTGGAVWVNSGTVDMTGGGIINTPFTNQATGVVILDGDPFASGDTITNAGTMETDSTGVTNFYAPITDTGTINIANAETLLFTEGGDFSGPFAGSGLLMLEGGVSTLASTFSHGGVLEIVNGTIALGGTTTTLAGLTTLQGAVFDGPGTVASTGVVTVQVDNTQFADGAVWVNSGTVDMTGGGIINTPFTNQATGVVILDGDPFASGDTITNAGTLETDSTGVTNFYAPITDTGTINIANAETLLFTEGGDFSGPVAGSGLLMLEGGVSTLASTFSHGGVLEIVNGTIALGGTTTTLAGLTTLQGAVFDGPGTVASTGVVTVQVDNTQFADGAVWVNSGTVDMTGGGIINTPFTNQATGVVILDGDPFASGDTITNAGTLETGSTAVTDFYAPITDTGSIDIASGDTLLFTEGGDFAGPVVGSGLLMLGGGVSTLASTFSHGGVLEIVNGTIALGGTTTTLAGLTTLQGAVFDGPGAVASTGVVTVQVDDTQLTGGAVWVNSGTVDVTGGGIIDTLFTNQATGVVILDGDPFAGSDTITNAGTLETGSTGATDFYAPITDTGSIDIASGDTLIFYDGGTFSGPVDGPGVMEVNGTASGSIALSNDATLDLDGTLTTGATLSFTGADQSLILGANADMLAEISGFGDGDTISIQGQTVVSAAFNSSTDVLAITGSSGSVFDVHLSGSYQQSSFSVQNGDVVASPVYDDFTGDRTSDILWYDNTSGDTGDWLMSGGQVSAWQDLGDVATSYSVAGVGNFTSDGTSDILWRNATTGDTGYWAIPLGGGQPTWDDLGTVATSYSVVGIGDFTGSGTSDILWRNGTTGDTGYWTMSAGNVSNWTDLGDVSTAYNVVGTGDFTGNGKSDILWQNSTTGDTGIWMLTGNGPPAWLDYGDISFAYPVVGIGDFNGDGIDDILFRNPTTGDTGYWEMNSSAQPSWVDLGKVSTAYSVIGVGDFTGNGISDILWRDSATGDTGYWAMNASGKVGGWVDLGNVPATYAVPKTT